MAELLNWNAPGRLSFEAAKIMISELEIEMLA